MSGFVITCPDCGTRYKATAASLGYDGRTVRCVKCESTWFVPAPDAIDTIIADPDALALADSMAEQNEPLFTAEPESSLDAGSAPETASNSAPSVGQAPLSRPPANVGADVMMRNHVDREKLARRHRTIGFIWAVPIVLVILAALIAYFNRQDIVNRIPQMASIYNVVGVEVVVGGLKIDPPQARTVLVEGEPVIRIETVVRNLTRKSKAVPLIELTLHDVDGVDLVQWYVEPDPNRIEGRGRLVFTSEISDPPVGSVGLRYELAYGTQLSAANGL